MDINCTFSGVAVAGMPSAFRAVAAAAPLALQVPAAHPAGAQWPAAAAIAPQRKRRTTAATGESVDRSLI